MSNLQRAVVAVVAIVAAVTLGIVQHTDTLPVAVIMAATGFVFGDRNGEQRTARTIAATTAEQAVDELVGQSLAKLGAANTAAVVDVRDIPVKPLKPTE